MSRWWWLVFVACRDPGELVVTSLVVAPAAPEDGQTLRCVATVDDPLGPRPTLVWTRDGDTVDVASVVDTEGVVSEVPGALVRFGETWRCAALDGDDELDAAEVTVPEPVGGNVLVFVLDDVGTDRLWAFSDYDGQPVTPRLDQLADAGVRLTRAWAYPSCSPTRAALQTGRQPSRYGIGEPLPWFRDLIELPDDEVTLAEALRDHTPAAYATGAFGKWHLTSAGYPSTFDHPNRAGYDHAAILPGNLGEELSIDGSPSDYFSFEVIVDGEASRLEGYATSWVADQAIAWLADAPEPWLAYVSFPAAHTPLHVPPDGLYTTAVTDESPSPVKYAAVVEAMDHEIGRVLDALASDVRARTTVVALGDNGTSQTGVVPPFAEDRAKFTMYESGVRVPVIVAGPAVGEAGTRIAGPVATVDLFATLAHIAGVHLADLPALPSEGGTSRVIDGVSVLPSLRDASVEPGHLVLTQQFDKGPPPYDVPGWAVRDADRKVVVFDLPAGRTVGLFRTSGPMELEAALDPRDLAADDLAAFDALLTAGLQLQDGAPYAY